VLPEEDEREEEKSESPSLFGTLKDRIANFMKASPASPAKPEIDSNELLEEKKVAFGLGESPDRLRREAKEGYNPQIGNTNKHNRFQAEAETFA